MNLFFISPKVSVIDVDTEFNKNWAVLCTTSPIFPCFTILEDLGEFGDDGTKFAQVADSVMQICNLAEISGF